MEGWRQLGEWSQATDTLLLPAEVDYINDCRYQFGYGAANSAVDMLKPFKDAAGFVLSSLKRMHPHRKPKQSRVASKI